MIRIRTNEGKRKCIQLTWKGFEYAVKVINGNNTVFEVSEESFEKEKKGQKRNRCCRLCAGCNIAVLLTQKLKVVTF